MSSTACNPALNNYQAALAKRIAKKLWNQGADPKTMEEMRELIAKANGLQAADPATGKVSDSMCMRVDDEMEAICHKQCPGSGCLLLVDRPDGKTDGYGHTATAKIGAEVVLPKAEKAIAEFNNRFTRMPSSVAIMIGNDWLNGGHVVIPEQVFADYPCEPAYLNDGSKEDRSIAVVRNAYQKRAMGR